MRLVFALLTLMAAARLAGCAGVPNSSSPRAIGAVERPMPSDVARPRPGMEPQVLLREFLKATADPSNRHLTARQFLTRAASDNWDDAGSAVLIDHVEFTETSAGDRVSVAMGAHVLGSLSDIGVFETGAGPLPDPGPIELVRTAEGWRIDRLPDGVFLDWKQFQDTYKRHTLYYGDPTGATVVPDPRYVAVSDADHLATELVSKLIAGPRPEMANAVRNLIGAPVQLRGPVTRADGGRSGVGRDYGGVRIELQGLPAADPKSRQLVAAQLIWTLHRADVKGPYVIQTDGTALDDRFSGGWTTSDVATTDPGAADSAGVGVHALLGGALVALDGQRTRPVTGAFGRSGDQALATLSRNGEQVASVVAPRPGGPEPNLWSLWIGRLGGEAVRAAEGHGFSRPSWSLDGAVWVVVDGTTVVRAISDGASGRTARIPVDSGAVAARFPGRISELALSRDGTRAALVIEGQVVLAGVEQGKAGQFALTYPRRLGFGLGTSAVSLCWRTGDDIVVGRADPGHPVSYVNIDGVDSDAPPGNLQQPVSVVAAGASMLYAADPRGVLQLSSTAGDRGNGWIPIPALMTPGSVPVLPG